MSQIYWFYLMMVVGEGVLAHNAIASNFSLICHEMYFTAYWTKAQYGENSFAAVSYSISLLDSSCNSYEQNSTHLWLTSYFTDCGAIITDYNDTIKQENTATVTAHYFDNGIIHKDKYFIYTIHCSFSRQVGRLNYLHTYTL